MRQSSMKQVQDKLTTTVADTCFEKLNCKFQDFHVDHYAL